MRNRAYLHQTQQLWDVQSCRHVQMPSRSSPTPNYRRRALLAAALSLTVGALVAPAVVTADETYTLSYVGVDYEANAVHETASFWTALDEDERSAMTAARRTGSVSLSERPRFLDGEDGRFSLVHDERVYQYRLNHAYDPWWFTYRLEAILTGLALTGGTVVWGTIRRLDTLWE